MKLIVGLGNPGAQYDKTRHNAGFMVVDALASKHAVGAIAKARFSSATLDANIKGEKVLLMKPTVFMNRSGQSVGEAVRFFKLEPAEDVLVVVDDIALPVGSIRLRKSGGSGGHNGLSDIDRALGGADYPRLRVGVGAVPKLMNQADWVLSRFMSEEKTDLDTAIKDSVFAVEHVLEHGIISAMNAFNKKLETKPIPETPNDIRSSGDSDHDTASDSNTKDPRAERDAG